MNRWHVAPVIKRTSRRQLRLETLECRTVPAVTIGQNFAGETSSVSGWFPPDTVGSIGPNHYVQIVNGRFNVYNKLTGASVMAKNDTAFWIAAGITPATPVGDPRVYYDPLSSRWFAVEFTEESASNLILVARSDSTDPTGTWKAASYVGSAGLFADYPTLGVDANGVYIGTNNFTNSLQSVTMTSIPKADLLLATPTVANRTMVTQGGFGMGFSLQGVTNSAANPAYASVIAANATSFGQVNRTKITGTGGPGATFGTTSVIGVQSTRDPGLARQPNGSRVVEGNDDRIGTMVYQVGDLIYLVHGISVNSSGVATTTGASTTDAVRLTVLRDSTTTVVTEATYFNTNFDYIYPSVCANAFGDILIGFTRSSAAAGSGQTDGKLGSYAVSARIDPANPGAGITFGTELQLKVGLVNNYNISFSGRVRWGDYSATGVDPTNPLAFWTTQEFAVASNAWGTQISQVFFSPRAGNVTSTVANGTYGFGAVIPITVTFNNPVTVTGNPQIALNAGGGSLATYVSGSGTATLTFDYTVGSGQTAADLDYTSTAALTLNGGTIKDSISALDAELTLAAPGAAGSLGANKNIVIDTSLARVSNVSSTAANGTYGLSATIPITIAFSSAVTVTGTPQLALNAGGSAIANYLSGSGTATLTFNYTVAAGHASADLDYTSNTALTLNGGTIKDSSTSLDADMTLAAPGAAGSLGANKNIVIDVTPPVVGNVTSSSANGTYVFGAVIPITVTFNKAVLVTGSPQLSLNSGGIAGYASGGGSNTLTFNYTVGTGELSADLDYTTINALTLNGGTITEQSSGLNANLTLPTPGAAGSLGANKSIVVDATPPVVSNVTSTSANGTYFFGTVIPITVTFNKVVAVTGTPRLALNSGGTANYSSGTGTATLTFNYTVGAGEGSADLDYSSTGALTLNGGTITEQASGLNATLTLPTPGAAGSLGANKSIVIDTTPPIVSNVTSTSANGTYFFGAVIPITVTFNKVVAVTGTPQIALNSGGTANYTSGSGSTTLTFNYTVGAGQGSADLDYTSTGALTLNGGTINEQASGLNATLTLPAPGAAGSLGANKTIVIDTTPPVVSNVTSGSANGTYLFGAVIPITVTFSKVVAVTGTPQLALNSGGTANYSSGSGSTTLTFNYTVGAGDASADLDYTSTGALTLNGGTITEQASGLNATLTLPAPGAAGSLGANKSIVVDAIPPAITNVTSTSANGTYLFGATIPITVTFNKVVAVTGSPQLALNSGGTASYLSGSGTATLTFNYTVGTGEASADLDYTSTAALTLNGGTIAEQASGLTATLTLPAPGAAGSLGANKNIVIDGAAPFVTNVTSPNANGTYVNAAALSITIAFNRAVVVTGTPQLALNSGGTATYASGSGTTTLTFNYTVAAGEASADLDYASANALSLNGGTIKSQSNSQDVNLSLPTPGAAGSLGANKSIVIDAVGPGIVEFRVLFGKKKFNILGSSRFDLPWTLSGIQVVFDSPVATGNINSLTGITANKFTGRGTKTLTWNFAAKSKGLFAAALANTGANALKDADGNPIAAFSQAFKVLYGDFTADGIVDAADEAGVRANLTPPYQITPSNYNIFADLSGDGLVNLVDVGIARNRKGNSLP